jgi:hypothetical protein
LQGKVDLSYDKSDTEDRLCDVLFTCQHCGALHDVREIRRGLYLSQRRLDEFLALERGGPLGLGERISRRKITKTLMRGLRRS